MCFEQDKRVRFPKKRPLNEIRSFGKWDIVSQIAETYASVIAACDLVSNCRIVHVKPDFGPHVGRRDKRVCFPKKNDQTKCGHTNGIFSFGRDNCL